MKKFPPFFSTELQAEYVVSDGKLICGSEHVPVIKSIPRFVPRTNYASAFGEQWKRYRLTQLDSYTGQPITRVRLKRCMGELFDQLKDKLVLEAGCGAGRFTELLLAQGARVMSADLSEAVEANGDNFPVNEGHSIVQADITKLPFRPQQFDVVLCLGVIQHTVNPEATIQALYNQVRPGGYLVIDHYTYSLSYYTKTSALFRVFLRRVEPMKGIKITERLVKYLYPLHKAARSFYPFQVMLSRLSPASSYFHAHPELNDQIQYEWMLLDTHDSLTDYYKHFRSVRHIESFLQNLGATGIMARKGGNGVEARCQRPT